MKTWKKFILVLSIFGLFGCSNDDSLDPVNSPDPNPVAETQTGVFRDSEVAGLYYETETKSGITNSEGEFEYLEGENVTFYVGDIKLGSGPANQEMTPISIASTEGATLDSPEVKNIAAFLQTLDSDNDPSNGINISEETTDAITLDAIDFTQPIEKVLGEIVAEVNLVTGAELKIVYPEEAAVHLAETTGESYEPGIDVFSTFIPTLESWKPYPSTSVYWIHETNAEGNLVSSTMFEKYPKRILYRIEYTELQKDGLPVKYSQTYYSFGEAGKIVNVNVNYNENNTIAGFFRTNSDGSFNQNLQFELNEMLRVVEALFLNEDDEFWYREKYDLLDNGNTNVKTRYSSQTGNDESSVQRIEVFTYTEFGEFATKSVTDNNGVSEFKYTYTESRVLNEIYITISWDENWENTISYDNEERKIRQLIRNGDYITDYVEFYTNGDPKRAETYYQNFLYEIVEWAEDGTSIWKTIEEDGSYKLEYKDENDVVIKTEYYDADGNLTSTDG